MKNFNKLKQKKRTEQKNTHDKYIGKYNQNIDKRINIISNFLVGIQSKIIFFYNNVRMNVAVFFSG